MAREALIIDLPCLVKAVPSAGAERLIEVEASNQEVDSEGDVIDQKALLDAAPEFIRTGHLDIDHLSELGDRMGIANPEGYIVGRPTQVKDLGGGRTGVVARLFKATTFDPENNRFDAVWDSIQKGVQWRASIYGFPTEDGVEDCRGNICSSGATRFHIKAMDWRSLALTRNPVNDAIKGCARIVTAKSWIASVIAKGAPPSFSPNTQSGQPFSGKPSPDAPTSGGAPGLSPAGFVTPTIAMSEDGPQPPATHLAPRNLDDALGQYHRHIRKDCPHFGGLNTTLGFARHFESCCGMPPVESEILAHALMHVLLLERRGGR